MARQRQDTKGSWGELILFVLIIFCIYLILSLFNSSLTGEGGREWGHWLRNNWGGAVIVILLFWLYLCVAKLLKLRIPRLPRQILGTVQLYISFAFMLGFLRETGWTSELTLLRPGNFGSGLAKFFVLNIGTFITLILIACSFGLSAFFFGAKVLKITLPKIPSLRRIRRRRPRRSSSPRRYSDDTYNDEQPESILFTRKIPDPVLKSSQEDYYDDSLQLADIESINAERNFTFNFQMPNLKPAPEDAKKKKQPEGLGPAGQNTIEMIDDALALLGSIDSPQKKSSKPQTSRVKKIRRPLPEITFPESNPDTSSRKADSTDKIDYSDSGFPPPAEILGERSKFDASRNAQKDSNKQSRIIVNTLKNFGITASVAQVVAGPSVTQYKLEIASGVKVSKVSGLDEELAMDLAVMSVRIEAPILGTRYVGVEVPAAERRIVSLRSMVESGEFINSAARLPLPLGVKTGGRILVRGLEEIAHMLIAGSEGSGRRTFVNSCVMSLCYMRRPEELKLLMIDPRHSEFSAYEGLPHLLSAPVNDIKSAGKALEWACNEMDRRTADFASEKAKNIEAYNRKVKTSKRLPEIAIIISELADLIYSNDSGISEMLVKLARQSETAGIYLLISAQKPSADVFTSQIKSLIPARAVFALSSQNESKNAVDSLDAAKLTGKGDMLFMSTANPVPVRLQAPYVSEEKITDFVEYMTSNLEPAELMTF